LGPVHAWKGCERRLGLITHWSIEPDISGRYIEHKARTAAAGDQTLDQTGIDQALPGPWIDQLVQNGQNIGAIWIRHEV
jgi:hypothetical protein